MSSRNASVSMVTVKTYFGVVNLGFKSLDIKSLFINTWLVDKKKESGAGLQERNGVKIYCRRLLHLFN